MKSYKKPRARSRASRLRQSLGQMAADNRTERTAVTIQSSENDARARIQERLPDATAEEIERRVAGVMKGGARPTTAQGTELDGILPQDVARREVDKRKRKLLADQNGRARRLDVAIERLRRELPPWTPKGDRP